MSRTTRSVLSAALAFALVLGAAGPARASDVGDAYKEAKVKKDEIRKAGNDDAKRQAAEAALAETAKAKYDALSGQKAQMSRTDIMYLGWLQFWSGDRQGGIATVREAVTSKQESKYPKEIHGNLLDMLLENDEVDGAGIEAEKMRAEYGDTKEVKNAVLKIGIAFRDKLEFEKAAKWLRTALDIGHIDAPKPLVTSLLALGKKDEAVAAAKAALDSIPSQKEDLEVLLDATQKIGTNVTELLAFDAFVPAGDPEIKDKVLVLGFFNVSSKTLKWTLATLDHFKKKYQDDITVLATTTYYKKNPDSGKIEPDMTPDAERTWGSTLLLGGDQMGWRGRIAYLKDEAATRALGMNALPHFVVVGKDGTLLFAHTLNYLQTDKKILEKILDHATGR